MATVKWSIVKEILNDVVIVISLSDIAKPKPFGDLTRRFIKTLVLPLNITKLVSLGNPEPVASKGV